MKVDRNIASIWACFGVLLILIGPLTGLPVSVPGKPVWYQDSFFIALVCGGGIGLITAVLYVVGLFRRMHWNLIDGCVLIILTYSMLRLSIQEVIPHTAWIQLLFFGGLYFTGRILFRQLSEMSIPWLLTGVLWTGIAQAVYGLGQLYGIWASHHAAFPVTGSFFNPGPYGGWLACLIPIGIWALRYGKWESAIGRIVRMSAWMYLFFGGAVLIAAFSRAAWLAAAAGSLVVIFPVVRSFLPSSVKRSGWLLTVTGVVLIGILSTLYFLKKDSADGRLLIWSVSMEMISDYPLFGVGWDRFKVMYPRHQAYYFDNGRGDERQAYLAGYTEYPFNELLGWMTEMGLIGLLLLAMIPVIFIRSWYLNHFYRSDRRTGLNRSDDVGRNIPESVSGPLGKYRVLVGSVLLTWMIFASFSYPTEIPVLWIVGIMAFSAFVTVTPDLPRLHHPGFRKANLAIIAVIVVISGVYSFYWTRANYTISKTWISANANYQLGRYGISNDIYQNKLWPALMNEGAYLQFAGKSLSMSRQFYPSRRFLERALYFSTDPAILTALGQDYTLFSMVEPENIERAEFLLKLAKHMTPSRYYPRYLLMDLYTRTGQKEKEQEEAAGILAMEVKVESEAVVQILDAARNRLDYSNNFIIKNISKMTSQK